MLRRILILLMLILLPLAALAEAFVPYEVFTFSASLPERLREPLRDWVQDESRILSSAAIQSNGGDYGTDCYAALILVDTAEGARLIAAAQPEGLPWQVDDFTHLLRSRQNVSVSIYMDEYTRVPCFSVDYQVQGRLVSDLVVFWKLWYMEGHVNQAQNITIGNEMGMIAVTDETGHELFRCDTPFFLDYMTDIAAFPTNRAEAQANTWLPEYAPFSAGMTLYCKGANLRMEPTTKSESLGQYAQNVPMIFTGEQKQGTSWPWYQVRIDNTLGWMSGNYVGDEPDWGYEPVSLGRTVYGCTLYATADDTQPVVRLEPGTTFHILTEYKGMYHICIPRGDISWAVDAEGTYGYVPAENILTGASPSALDAQSAK